MMRKSHVTWLDRYTRANDNHPYTAICLLVSLPEHTQAGRAANKLLVIVGAIINRLRSSIILVPHKSLPLEGKVARSAG